MSSQICIKDGPFWTRIVIGGIDSPGEDYLEKGCTNAKALAKHLESEQKRANIDQIHEIAMFVEYSGLLDSLLEGTLINTKRVEPNMYISKSAVRFGFILDALFQSLIAGGN